jgi:hypothetical protein
MARRALNEIVTTSRRGAAWEEVIARKELARYLKGNESPPKARVTPAKESLRAENKRLAEDTFRTYFWLRHGPGYAGAGHPETARVGQEYQRLRGALNDNVRRLDAHLTAERTAAALREHTNVPGMRDLLSGKPVAVRLGDTVQIVQPRGTLTPNGLPIAAYRLGETQPYFTSTVAPGSIKYAISGENRAYLRALSPEWRPPSSARGAIGKAAADYRQQPTLQLEEQLLAYTGTKAARSTSARTPRTRAKKSA